MGNFRRDNNRSSGGGFGRKSFGGRDGGRPAMHRATCNECGDNCEVPFKPTGDKPIYCSECFGRQKSSGGDRPSFGGGRSERRERPSFDRGDRQMHDAVCAKCNDDCQVPFRPTSSKPVYCSNCFEKGDKNSGGRGAGQSSDQLKEVNDKLDMIMTALGLSPAKKVKDKIFKKEKKEKRDKNEKKEKEVEIVKSEPVVAEAKIDKKVPAKKVAKKTTKKEAKPKKTEKKVVAKKAPAKKKVTAKKAVTKKKAVVKKKK